MILTVLLPPILHATLSVGDVKKIPVRVRETLRALEYDEDTDGDRRITVEDGRVLKTGRGDKRFWFKSLDGERIEIVGTYYLSNLLQELKLADQRGLDTLMLDPERLFEPPASRIARNIRELFWDGLTRRIDEDGLLKIIADEKTASSDGYRYLYVPSTDHDACAFYDELAGRHPDWRIRVTRVPATITPEVLKSLEDRHGLLTLALRRTPGVGVEAVPFVVPGGRFNEMYGWDSYFIALGLLQDGRTELARAMVDNFVYEIRCYGAILNANRTYYLTRSQPPFLTSMISAVYAALPRSEDSQRWLMNTLRAAVFEYHNVWMNGDRLTPTGLSRYHDAGRGIPPEVEPGHFSSLLAPFAARHGVSVMEFEHRYRLGTIAEPELDTLLIHDRAMRESGHDTSYRLLDNAADLVTVDLNALLYKTESDLAEMIEEHFSGTLVMEDGSRQTASLWRDRAEGRRRLIDRFLWDDERGMYFDYDYRAGVRTTYESATTLYPLWAGCATPEQAKALVANAIPVLEEAGGIVSSTETSRGPVSEARPQRQWDYPNGWAPHQILAWGGLQRYGYDAIARRLAYRWLYTIAVNAANYNGTMPEKFDVHLRSHQVFAEYGNVGTKFAYITREGFGWTNASVQLGRVLLGESLWTQLDDLIPPEWIGMW